MNSIRQKLSSLDPKARQVFWMAITLAAVMFGYGIYAIPYILNSQWIIKTLSNLMPSLMGAGALVSALLILNGRKVFGGSILIAISALGLLAVSGLVADLGFLLAVLAFVVTASVANFILPERLFNWAPVFSLLVGSAILLLDSFCPWPRDWVGPRDAQIAAILGVALMPVYIFLVARQFASFSLRTKITLGFLAATVIPVAALSASSSYLTRQALEKAANDDLTSSAAQVAGTLDAFVASNLDTIRGDAQIRDFAAFLALSPEEREDSPIKQRVQSILQAYRKRSPTYVTSYGLIDAHGIDVADTSLVDVGTDKSDREYFQAPMRTGLPYASDLFVSKVLDEPSIFFTAPVRDENGLLIGVIRVRYNADILQQMMVKTSLAGQHDSVMLVDEHQILLADSLSPGRIYKAIMPLTAVELKDRRQRSLLLPGLPDDQQSVPMPDLMNGLVRARGENEPTFAGRFHFFESSDHSNNPYQQIEQAAAVRMQNRAWYVVVARPQVELFAPVQAQTRSGVVLGVAVSLISVLIALGIARSIASPITELTEVALEVAAGDLKARAMVTRQDEFGVLARTFNKMAAELSAMFATLEQRVADRTRALYTSTEVSRRLSTILETNQLIREVVNQLQQAFNYYHVHIYLFDEDRQNLVLAGGSGEAGQVMLARGHKIARGRGLVGRAAENGVPVLAADVSQAEGWLPNPLLPDTRSELAVPIAIGDNILGVIDVQQDQINGLTREDEDLLQSIANQVAVALQNARTYAQVQRQASREALITAVGQRIQRTTSPEEALQVATREVGRALGGQHVYIKVDVRDRDSN